MFSSGNPETGSRPLSTFRQEDENPSFESLIVHSFPSLHFHWGARNPSPRKHTFNMVMVGSSDATYWHQSTEGKCRLGFAIGLMSSSLKGPRHILQRTPKYPREMVKSSFGGEVYAHSEMVGHTPLSKDRYGPFGGMNPGVGALEDCGGLDAHFRTKKMIAEKYLVRHFLSIQHVLGEGDLEGAYWLPGAENLAGGLTKVRSDMDPLLRLLESGAFCPGRLRPLKSVHGSVAWKG